MSMDQTTSKFIETIPSIPASVTVEAEKEPCTTKEIREKFETLIQKLSKSTKYEQLLVNFKVGQMYGKNGSFDHFLSSLEDTLKHAATDELKKPTELLCKNLKQTAACIEAITPLKPEVFIAALLGFTISIVEKLDN